MANVVLPMLVSMMLGKTIDLTNYTIGGQIYNDSDYEESRIDTAIHTYSILKKNNGLPYDDIGYPVDINLRIKADLLKSQIDQDLNVDELFKSKYWYTSTSAVFSYTSKIMKVKKTLREDAQPLNGWQDSVPDTQTHYVKSMTYGGLNYFFKEYECFTIEDAANVRKILLSKLGEHGEMNNATDELFDQAFEEIARNPDIRKKCNYYTYTYTTMDIDSIYYVGNILKTMSEMPKAVGDVGVPIFIELAPLHELDETYPEVTENHDFENELDKIAEMYDDTRKTYARLLNWKEENKKAFSKVDNKKLNNFEEHLKDCNEKFKEVASQISNYKKLDPSMWQSAVELYNSRLNDEIHNYLYLFIDLRQDIDPDCKNAFLKKKIKGLLDVKKNERIVHKNKDMKECKKACYEEPKCVAIGSRADKCYIYFRGSATRNVTGPKNSAVYNRKCEFSYLWN